MSHVFIFFTAISYAIWPYVTCQIKKSIHASLLISRVKGHGCLGVRRTRVGWILPQGPITDRVAVFVPRGTRYGD